MATDEPMDEQALAILEALHAPDAYGHCPSCTRGSWVGVRSPCPVLILVTEVKRLREAAHHE
jgi:hypothetical protein